MTFRARPICRACVSFSPGRAPTRRARERGVTECSRRLLSLLPRGEGFSSLRANGQSRVHAQDAPDPLAPRNDDAKIRSRGAFAKFKEIGAWRRTVIAASNFPEVNPAGKNSHAIVPRLEWAAWREAGRLDERIRTETIFGDFGADTGKIVFADGGGGAIVHLRYATPESWLVPRGGPTTEKFDGSIRFVADRIVNSKVFAGDWFSWGDEFIADCATRAGGPGNSTIWRAANMNHHMTRAVIDVERRLGREIAQPRQRLTAAQQPLPL